MKRPEAEKLLHHHLKNKNLIKHSLAVEAVMRGLAKHLGENRELWGIAGLVHDIDYDWTKDAMAKHSLEGARILKENGFSEDLVYAVKVHNHIHGLPRISLLDKALYAADPVTGLITAGALILKEKKLSSVDVPFLIKRFAEKSFARGANRETILSCTELGLTLEEFLSISLSAMQEISQEIGL
ncbi:MAG: HDIG domain-containing protein [Peptococcaceae bacterium]|nr:HDIG domain-containing protein [Peptococcaceae bacterium]